VRVNVITRENTWWIHCYLSLIDQHKQALTSNFSGFINNRHVESFGSLILALWLVHLLLICTKLLGKVPQFKNLGSAPTNKNEVHDKTTKGNSRNICY
jgi:hypothetical protein